MPDYGVFLLYLLGCFQNILSIFTLMSSHPTSHHVSGPNIPRGFHLGMETIIEQVLR